MFLPHRPIPEPLFTILRATERTHRPTRESPGHQAGDETQRHVMGTAEWVAGSRGGDGGGAEVSVWGLLRSERKTPKSPPRHQRREMKRLILTPGQRASVWPKSQSRSRLGIRRGKNQNDCSYSRLEQGNGVARALSVIRRIAICGLVGMEPVILSLK